jgi:threonylcarbamoyladenosine tRNA methylthiotransferase CDKAL1
LNGLVRVYVEVYGCSANQADAEIASGLLLEAGHILVDREEDADVSVLLTCVVKTPTEQKIVKRLSSLEGRRLVVAGCMPKALRSVVENVAPNSSLVGPDDIARIPEAVAEAASGGKAIFLEGSSPDRTFLPRHRRSGLIHIAPISAGCLGNCAYCIVKLARGRLYSFPPSGIVKDSEEAVRSGCREIWVTAEDTAAYESDGVKLPELLRMLGEIEGRFMIRIGMMTPNSALPILDELIKAFRGEKVFRFLHVPVQTGSDEVLSSMRRRYTVAEFRELVTRFRAEIPDISIATDVICGFPGETEDQFKESLDLIEWLRPDMVNINRFSVRPGTEAVVLDGQHHGRVIKNRSRRLDNLWWKLVADVNSRWVGWDGEVLLDEPGHSGLKVARNPSYKAITVKTDTELGEFVKVRVTGVGRGYLLGETI